MYMLIASYVFYKAVDEDDDAARGTRRVVSAGIERSRLGTREPGFGEAGHGGEGGSSYNGRLKPAYEGFFGVQQAALYFPGICKVMTRLGL